MFKFAGLKVLIIFSLLAGLTACAKMPDAPLSPSVKIDIEKKGDVKTVAVNFSCGLKNDNSDTAFTEIDGLIEVKDESGITVLSVPFKKTAILPFETGIIQEKIELTSESAAPLLKLLSIKSEQLESGEDQGSRFLDDSNVIMKRFEVKKTDIIELLRSKLTK